MTTLCAGKVNTVSTVRDYQVAVLDYYMLSNLYVQNYMCSTMCPCVSKANLDLRLWNNDELNIINNDMVFTGTYRSFYQCYVDL